eukprot:g43518.t1
MTDEFGYAHVPAKGMPSAVPSHRRISAEQRGFFRCGWQNHVNFMSETLCAASGHEVISGLKLSNSWLVAQTLLKSYGIAILSPGALVFQMNRRVRLPVLDGVWRKGDWDRLSDLVAALHTATDYYQHLHAQQEAALMHGHGLQEDAELAAGSDEITNCLLQRLHPYTQVVQAVRAVLESELGGAGAAAAAAEPDLPARKKARSGAATRTQCFLVPQALEELVVRERPAILALAARQLVQLDSAEQLKELVQELRNETRWKPRPLGTSLPAAQSKALVRSRQFYGCLYMAATGGQATAVVCSVEAISNFRQRKGLLPVVDTLKQLQHRVLGFGADLVARQRLLCVLYSFARLWAATGQGLSVPLTELYTLALEALPLALTPVLQAKHTAGPSLPLLGSGLGGQERRCFSLSHTARTEPQAKTTELRLLEDAARGRLYLPVCLAPTQRPAELQSSELVTEACRALQALARAVCVGPATSALLARLPRSVKKAAGAAPGPAKARLALLPNALGTGALECSIAAYRGGLSYTLAGPWRPRGPCPAVLRTSAEQQEVEALAWAPDMCQCLASERRCTEWLQRWWDRPGSERFELVVDGRASWTGLQCVDAQQHTDQGRAQLFALSVHLGPDPAPPANARADDEEEVEEVEEIEPEPLDGEEGA